VLIVWISKFVSLGSVSVAVLYPVAVYGHISVILRDIPKTERPATGILLLITIVIAIMIVYMHRENLKRISNGTERKFSVGGKKKKDAAGGKSE
jgi:glycerol-3-phosphate acyltransferase PlsY